MARIAFVMGGGWMAMLPGFGCGFQGARVVDKPVADLVDDLSSWNGSTRYNAAFTLNQLKPPDPSTVSPLIEAVRRESDDSVRSIMLWALFHAAPDNPEIVDGAIALLSHGRTTESRIDSAELLGRIGPAESDRSVPALIAALADPECGQQAARALGRIGPRARPAAAPLISALKNPSPVPWIPNFIIADTLAEIDAAPELAVPALVDALGQNDLDDQSIIDAIAHYGPKAGDAVPAMLRVVEEGRNDYTQAKAIRSLSLIGDRSEVIVSALARALSSPEASVKYAAADTLGEMGAAARSVVPALIATLDSEAQEVRNAATAALGKIAAPDDQVARAALNTMLRDPEVKSTAVHSLELIKTRTK